MTRGDGVIRWLRMRSETKQLALQVSCELSAVAIRAKGQPNFTGTGVAVCNRLATLPYSLLTQETPVLKGCSLAEDLFQMAHRDSRFHDGFHLLCNQLKFAKVACFVAPNIPSEVNASTMSCGGCRHATAYLLSMHEDVVCTGIVDGNYRVTVFVDGQRVNARTWFDVPLALQELTCKTTSEMA